MKTTNKKGFTIIEVVITIAIGAAVMALVLNAVAGARRSQRNNARAADVNQIAAGVNQYLATRNALPTIWADVSGIVDSDKFGHYEGNAGSCSDSSKVNAGACTGTWDHDVDPLTADIARVWSAGSSSINVNKTWTSSQPVNDGQFVDLGAATGAAAPANLNEDQVLVLIKASCATVAGQAQKGGIREMAILYRLEGQTDAVCLEI